MKCLNMESCEETRGTPDRWYHFNKDMFSVKTFYFCCMAGIAALLPYVQIYLHQKGFDTKEIALVNGLNFFLTFPKNIFVGALADRFKAHKLIVIISCVLTGPLFCMMMVIPNKDVSPHTVYCDNTSSTNLTLPVQVSLNGVQNNVLYYCNESPSCPILCTELPNPIPPNTTNTTNTTDTTDTTSPICEYKLNCKSYTSLTFWLTTLLFLLAGFTNSNQTVLNDAIAMKVLGAKRSFWGYSRLWGSIGYGVSTVCSSLLVMYAGHGDKFNIDYTPAFYVNLALNLCAALTGFFYNSKILNQSQTPNEQNKNGPGILKVISKPRVLVFLTMILLLGIYNGIALIYIIYFLKMEFDASQLTLSMVALTPVIVEIPVLFIGGAVVTKIGTNPCFYLSFLAYGVRFMALKFIENPWLGIAVESTHLFTFGLMYVAANMHAAKIVNEDSLATIIGLFNGLKWGIGIGVGSMIGGELVTMFGFRDFFLGTSITALVFMVIFIIVNEVFFKYFCLEPQQQDEKLPVKLNCVDEDINETNKPLMNGEETTELTG